jgi:hypothetical protein
MPTTQWREAGILSVRVKPVSVKDLVDEIRRVMDKPGKPHKARPTRLS